MGTTEALLREQFLCPIPSEIMRNPVFLASGDNVPDFPFLLPSVLRNFGNMCNPDLQKDSYYTNHLE
ncbi:hypothetical protein QYE76_070369 [Lolium multiflorum]|uniref:U-box domain-containing protein n=1 Tax=Lolium multiflorum TaxID=4521 RepID=A0AAD8WFT1_LOLMU|nr:hypothetical protein QYE76_070369 [Lolium multiflorum]